MTRNEILSFASKWIQLENIILGEISHIWTLALKKKNGNTLGHGSHTKGRTHTEGIGKGKKPKTWKCLICSL
jgi:hypothetical protein